jgi:hypothetical protein
MRTRSGLTYNDVRAGINVARTAGRAASRAVRGARRAVRARKERRAVRPAEVRQIVQRTIAAATDKRVFQEIQPALTIKRLFTNQLLCSRITQGVTNSTRTGEKIHLRTFTTKFIMTHTGNAPLGVATNKSTLAAPIYLHMYLIRTNRSDDPETYWFKDLSSDGDVAYSTPRGEGTAQITAVSDQRRFQNRLNTDDLKILKYKKVGVSPVMAQGDPIGCSFRQFTFSYTWKKPTTIQYNATAAAVPPFAPTDLSKRFYFITYLSQPDANVDDTLSTAAVGSVSYTYFNDN